jgi:predicted DNA-binding transcriptional regulator AlpA
MGIKESRAATSQHELLTDRQGAELLNISETKFADLQRRPDFPRALWLGPRCKRHVRPSLLDWAKTLQRSEVSE